MDKILVLKKLDNIEFFTFKTVKCSTLISNQSSYSNFDFLVNLYFVPHSDWIVTKCWSIWLALLNDSWIADIEVKRKKEKENALIWD